MPAPEYSNKDLLYRQQRFGRYTDVYKSPAQMRSWEAANKTFEAGQYLSAYQHFLDYLSDEREQNLHYELRGDTLYFVFFQGSKRIEGWANEKQLHAEARIAKAAELDARWMQRLLLRNYQLSYTRFGLDAEQTLCLRFDTYTLDSSPFKLYYALKELAQQADRLDDALLAEFANLENLDSEHTAPLSEREYEVKCRFIQERLQEGKALRRYQMERQLAGGLVYQLLAIAYKLDYLITPEGALRDTIEAMHRGYFANDGKNIILKTEGLFKHLENLINRPPQSYLSELYRISSTFGMTNQVGHERIRRLIGDDFHGELQAMDWYLDNGYEEIALAIPSYIAGYALFNYAVPEPLRDLFHLHYMLCEPAFFKDLGCPQVYGDEAGKLDEKAIWNTLEEWMALHQPNYPRLRIRRENLAFEHLGVFMRSFFRAIRELDLSKERQPV